MTTNISESDIIEIVDSLLFTSTNLLHFDNEKPLHSERAVYFITGITNKYKHPLEINEVPFTAGIYRISLLVTHTNNYFIFVYQNTYKFLSDLDKPKLIEEYTNFREVFDLKEDTKVLNSLNKIK
jgi:hypothetical protein